MTERPPITSGLGVQIDTPKRPAPRKPAAAKALQGFAVLDGSGGMVWGTIRPTEDEARAMYRKWNPPINGYQMNETVVKVKFSIESLPKQREMFKD